MALVKLLLLPGTPDATAVAFNALVMNTGGRGVYDAILGREQMHLLGMVMDFGLVCCMFSCCSAAYAKLGQGLDLDALEAAATAIGSSSRRRDEASKKRDAEDAGDGQPKVRQALCGWGGVGTVRVLHCRLVKVLSFLVGTAHSARA
jgi:hypothetical protein